MCPVDAVGCSDTGVVGGGIELLVPFLALAVVIAIVAYVLVRRQRR
jgi:hypothetical protein